MTRGWRRPGPPSYGEAMQEIHPAAWIAPTAQLYGRVVVAEGASVWHNAVVRAECHDVRIGRMTNVQDFVMIHVAYERGTVVGEFCSVTHHVTLHGCTVEDHSLIGIGAVVMDGAASGAAPSSRAGRSSRKARSFRPARSSPGSPRR